jgi:hypothetical protein
MSIGKLVICVTAASAAGLPLLMGGCVSTSGDVQSARLGNNVQVYAPFDNERDAGPSYLVGAPAHHVGDEPQVDDGRAAGPKSAGATATDPASPADPKGPPLTSSPQTNSDSGPHSDPSPPPPPQPLP